jgi:hypothetical protein
MPAPFLYLPLFNLTICLITVTHKIGLDDGLAAEIKKNEDCLRNI